jgi:hypothetical protein
VDRPNSALITQAFCRAEYDGKAVSIDQRCDWEDGQPGSGECLASHIWSNEMIDFIKFVLAFEKAPGSWKFSLQISVG